MNKHVRMLGPGMVGSRKRAGAHVRVLAPGLLAFTSASSAEARQDCPHDTDSDGCERELGDDDTSCGQHADAMVCGQVPERNDICSFGDVRRGCYYGNQDVDPGTDFCCFGLGSMNDSIDHATCQGMYDAPWGGGGPSCPWGDGACGSSDFWI